MNQINAADMQRSMRQTIAAQTACAQAVNSYNSDGIKPSTVRGEMSPIMERLSLIADEVAHAHSNMNELERQLEPIIAHSPQDDSEAKANHEACDMEAKLVAIYNHVRGLNARMTIMRNDLRI